MRAFYALTMSRTSSEFEDHCDVPWLVTTTARLAHIAVVPRHASVYTQMGPPGASPALAADGGDNFGWTSRGRTVRNPQVGPAHSASDALIPKVGRWAPESTYRRRQPLQRHTVIRRRRP